MSTIPRLTSLNLALVCAGVLVSGCYGMYRGSKAEVQPVPRSERILSDSLVLTISRRPVPQNPTLVVRLVRRQEVRYQVVTTYNEMRGPRKGRAVAMGVLFGGAGLALLIAKGDTATSEGQTYIVVGAGVSIISALVTLGVVKKEQKATGRVIRGERDTKRETRPDQPVPAVDLTVRLGRAVETLTTDSDGLIRIDLPARLGKGPFTGREVQRLEVEALKGTVRLESAVATTEWTTACIQTTGRGSIFAQPRADADRPLEYKPGQLMVLKSDGNSGWYEVSIPNGSGWIPRQLAVGGCRAVFP
jgi:hypothetical protein